jgi:hypothetical protein
MFIFANNVNTSLSAALSSTATTMTISSTTGLPSLPVGDSIPMTLLDAATRSVREIVYVTNIGGSTLTIERGQEGTAALNWQVGDYVYSDNTAETTAPSNQAVGGILSGSMPNPGSVNLGGVLTGTLPSPGLASGSVAETQVASGAIHRAQLSTETAAGSISIGGDDVVVYSLIGGIFSFYTYHGAANAVPQSTGQAVVLGHNSSIGEGVLGLYNINFASSPTSTTAYIRENYINSSPPYNFGESFVYVAYDKDGKIVGISAALDPTHAHHGAHSIVPTHWREIGKPGTPAYQRKPMVYQDMLDGMIFSEAVKDASRRLAFLKGELTPERGEVEITIDYKDMDKETHPHPFGSDSVARVVLMNPEGPLANRVTDMLKAGHASEIVTMISDGDLIMANEGIIHPHAPSTIQVVTGSLR